MKKKMNKKKLEILLSQYIDGMLSEQEARKVESLLTADTVASQRVEELKRLKALLASKQKLTPDIGFWTRFSVALEETRRDERSFLPFPRKYIPVITLLTTVLVVAVGVIVIQNRTKFLQFFTEKSQTVQEVYNKDLLQGTLLPLFSKVDKDHALQFSLFGTLSLDDKSETGLRVDEQSEKGYRIEVGKDFKRKAKSVTFDHFIAEVKPTNEQRKIIDSLLELTGRRIESSVLIGENNTMAIAPDLPKLNKIMVTNIASCLEPRQQIRFERLLEANDAPYTVKRKTMTGAKRNRFFQSIPISPRDDRFVVITEDTMIYSQIHIDFDSLRRQMEEDFAPIRIRREAMLKRMMTREFRRMQRNTTSSPPVQVIGGEEFFSIEITNQGEEYEPQQMHVVIQPRARKQVLMQGMPNRSIQIRVWKDTASFSDTLQK
jgi:hypothetical protein